MHILDLCEHYFFLSVSYIHFENHLICRWQLILSYIISYFTCVLQAKWCGVTGKKPDHLYQHFRCPNDVNYMSNSYIVSGFLLFGTSSYSNYYKTFCLLEWWLKTVLRLLLLLRLERSRVQESLLLVPMTPNLHYKNGFGFGSLLSNIIKPIVYHLHVRILRLYIAVHVGFKN